MADCQQLALCRGTAGQLLEHLGQSARLASNLNPVTLYARARVQAVVLVTGHADHLHAALDSLDRRDEALPVEAIAVELVGRLVGRGNHHDAGVEHHFQQAPEDDRVADIADKKLVEAQHADFFAQLLRQRPQRVRGAGELEQALVHPTHEVVKMLAPGWPLQALVELIHQPGFATPDRPPQVNPVDPPGPLQRFKALLQGLYGVPLRFVCGKPALFDGLTVGGQG
ncbi:hypothetical protein D3C85_924910 [compost metagenome]